MKASIKYRLTQAGQRADLLAGGDGSAAKTVEVPRESPDFPRLVAVGAVAGDGSITLDLLTYHYSGPNVPDQDAPRTAAELLDAYDAARAAYAEKAERERVEAEERQRQREVETTAALAAHAALPLEERIHQPYSYPYWAPRDFPHVGREAPSAVEAQEECDRRNAEIKAAKDAEAEAAAVRRLAWRAERGLEEGDIALRIEEGALATVPPSCWESHKRGKNWLATISVDPSSPGGLARSFVPKAKGEFYYLLPDLAPGDAVEFGADYYSGGGRKNPTRWYGFFVRTIDSEPAYLVLRQCNTGTAAVKAGAAYAKEHRPQPGPVDEAIARVNSEGGIIPPASDN